MKTSKVSLISNIAVLLLSGCVIPGYKITSLDPTQIPPAIQPSAPTATHTLAPTEAPTLSPTDTPAPSPTAFVPFTASVWADNVNVRTNPGYLFPVARLLPKNTSVTILGKAPGGEWVSVKIPDGTSGWVFAQLVQTSIDLQGVPVIEPQDVLLIKGQVKDSSGTPIQGVGFTVVQGSGNRPPTNVVMTDSNGEFFSFMPSNSHGDWTVTYAAIACKSNVWADASCGSYKAPYRGLVEPQSVVVSLPQTGVLEFVWK